MKHWPVLVAMGCVLVTWGVMESLSHGEFVVAKKSFQEFPLEIASRWTGKALALEEEVLDKLRVSDYLLRVYDPLHGRHPEMVVEGIGSVVLYVGFYASQRAGATYHSPKNCLPGAGWQFSESGTVSVPLHTGHRMTINKVIIQKGREKQVILYWYYDRGRVIASEYWAKGWMVWDAMTKNRTDGSLVRISVPVVDDTDQAFDVGVTFLNDMWDDLLEHMPVPPSTSV